MFLILGVVSVGILGMTTPAPSGYNTNTYNLQRVEISGVVQSVNNQEAYILTDDGQEIGVQLGPQSYWEERGYYLPVGEYVEMEVWYDPYEYTGWYFAGEIWGPGFHFVLTNNYGVPFWVVAEQDYYYSLGYRASCVSYMVWFDCPPFYFLNLFLPPPPPMYYSCYYGPRWRYSCSDWYYGPRFCSGGSYWNDGRGYQRPGRRIVGRSGNEHERNGGNYNPGDNNDRELYHRAPALPTKVKSPSSPRPEPRSKWYAPREKSQPQNKDNQLRKQPVKSQPQHERKVQRSTTPPRNEQKNQRKMVSSQKEQKSQQRVTSPRNEYKNQKRASTPAPERKLQAPKPEPRDRQYADRSVKPHQREHKSQIRFSKPQVREQKSQVRSGKPQVREQKSQVRSGKPQVREQKGSTHERQYSKPQSSKQDRRPQSMKQSGGRTQERRNRHR